jgi:hypothetical protein
MRATHLTAARLQLLEAAIYKLSAMEFVLVHFDGMWKLTGICDAVEKLNNLTGEPFNLQVALPHLLEKLPVKHPATQGEPTIGSVARLLRSAW